MVLNNINYDNDGNKGYEYDSEDDESDDCAQSKLNQYWY